jgi:hypothetical protein
MWEVDIAGQTQGNSSSKELLLIVDTHIRALMDPNMLDMDIAHTN